VRLVVALYGSWCLSVDPPSAQAQSAQPALRGG